MSDGVRQTVNGVVQTENGVAQTVLDTGPEVYEDFSEGDFSNYEGDTTPYSFTTSPVHSAGYALDGDGSSAQEFFRSDDKPGPSRGDTFEFYYWTTSGGDGRWSCIFAVDPNDNQNHYRAYVNHSGGSVSIYRDGDSTQIASGGLDRFGYTDQWNKVTVDFGATVSSDIELTVTSAGGTQMAQISTTDTTYDEGTFGFRMNDTGSSLYLDTLQDEGA